MMEVLRSVSLRVSLCKQPAGRPGGGRTGGSYWGEESCDPGGTGGGGFHPGLALGPRGGPSPPALHAPPLPSRLTRARSAGRGPRVGASTGLLALQERGARGVGVGYGETTSLGVTPGHVLGECSGGA